MSAELRVPHRLLTCRECGEAVAVIELSVPHLDPSEYVCGECLRPVESKPEPLPYNVFPEGF